MSTKRRIQFKRRKISSSLREMGYEGSLHEYRRHFVSITQQDEKEMRGLSHLIGFRCEGRGHRGEKYFEKQEAMSFKGSVLRSVQLASRLWMETLSHVQVKCTSWSVSFSVMAPCSHENIMVSAQEGNLSQRPVFFLVHSMLVTNRGH